MSPMCRTSKAVSVCGGVCVWGGGKLSLVQNLFDRSIGARVFSRRQDTGLVLLRYSSCRIEI